jgi:hypothetical protein
MLEYVTEDDELESGRGKFRRQETSDGHRAAAGPTGDLCGHRIRLKPLHDPAGSAQRHQQTPSTAPNV